MSLSKILASHLRSVFFGGNWTSSNLKTQLSNITLEQAHRRHDSCNSILALTFHIGYYISGVLEVFEGKPLTIRDQFSYEHPNIGSDREWQSLMDQLWIDVEALASHVEKLSDQQLWEDFTDAKYGHYYDNITGIIEHTHYHLGQIALLKKF